MKNYYSIFTILFLITSLKSNAQKNLSLIPEPTKLEVSGGYFTANNNTCIYANNDELLQNEIAYLQEYIKTLVYPVSQTAQPMPPSNCISLTVDEKIGNEDQYSLNIDDDGIEIKAGSSKGIFYGIQTLFQLGQSDIYKKNNGANFQVPCVKIEDQPAFPWRGMLLDCSRHCMEVDFVKKYIDLLAYHKMNTLHWHLIDDQGWRIEIDAYPKLTEIGAWREDVNNEAEGDKYGCYYSKKDIKDIVAYAESRHINMVPEIEMPGHCQSAFAAYPDLSCNGGDIKVETEWGVFKEIYCAGNPETYQFLENVLKEVLDLFPSKYIHIGGDEVPKFRWEHCEKCQAKITEHNLKDEEGLQSYFLGEINNFLKKNGRIMVGWDEIAEGGLPSNSIVQSWRGYEGAEHAIKNNHQTIVSPTSHAYFDYDLKAIDLEKVYSFNPIPKNTPSDKQKLVLGGECNMWSERAPQPTVDSKVFPRILAMSEVLWHSPKKRNFKIFKEKVKNHYKRLDAMGVDYGFEKTPISVKYNKSKNSSELEFIKGDEDLDIYFSINDSENKKYSAPLNLSETSLIKAISSKNGKAFPDTFKVNYNHHSSINADYKLASNYHKNYTGSGDGTLTDGFRGSTDFRDRNWQGFFGNDLIATFDFSKNPQEIKNVKVGCMQYNNSWIFLPPKITIEYSEDGVKYEELGCTRPSISARDRGRHLQTMQVAFMPKTVKYLRVKAQNYGKCPDWHEAAGSKAWLFVDEILVE